MDDRVKDFLEKTEKMSQSDLVKAVDDIANELYLVRENIFSLELALKESLGDLCKKKFHAEIPWLLVIVLMFAPCGMTVAFLLMLSRL